MPPPTPPRSLHHIRFSNLSNERIKGIQKGYHQAASTHTQDAVRLLRFSEKENEEKKRKKTFNFSMMRVNELNEQTQHILIK